MQYIVNSESKINQFVICKNVDCLFRKVIAMQKFYEGKNIKCPSRHFGFHSKKKSGTKKGLSGSERYWCFLCTSKMTAHNFSVKIFFFQRENFVFEFYKYYSNKKCILTILNTTEIRISDPCFEE